ncbi:MAG: hypothetical protein FWB73_00460 [Treponema sp.]|nr:hypothetical protein [Treponema sp.]
MAVAETNLILQFLERNFINIIILVCLVIVMIRGADKIFPRMKKAKIGPVEIERDCSDSNDNKDGEERRDCSNNRGRRATDVCKMHCDIAGIIESNTKALDELKNADIKLVEHEEEVWIMILEDRFYSPYRTKSVRMVSGLTYLWWGLNGDVKKDVLAFKEENPEVYKDVITCRPELQLGKYAEGRKPENV